MKIQEKINLIDNIAEKLNTKTYHHKRLFFQDCGINISWDDYNNIDLYESLLNAAEKKLITLASELEISPNIATLSKEYPKNWENETGLKAFISHASNAARYAHNLKDSLKKHNINCFVAHDDIQPSIPWEEQIEKALKTMDIFISIHGENSNNSTWCQQEIGFAKARDVDIIPIMTTNNGKKFLPEGFISKIQAMPIIDLPELSDKIVNTVRESKKIGKLYNTSINPLPVQINANYDDEIPF